MSELSVAETLYVMMNKASTEEIVVEEKDTADNVVEPVATTEKAKETEQADSTEACSENQTETTSEDPYCADKECKCHSNEESSEVESEDVEEDSKEELEKIRYIPVQDQPRFLYFPPEVNALAIVVLFLHLLNALLQLMDKNKIECFKRPY